MRERERERSSEEGTFRQSSCDYVHARPSAAFLLLSFRPPLSSPRFLFEKGFSLERRINEEMNVKVIGWFKLFERISPFLCNTIGFLSDGLASTLYPGLKEILLQQYNNAGYNVLQSLRRCRLIINSQNEARFFFSSFFRNETRLARDEISRLR